MVERKSNVLREIRSLHSIFSLDGKLGGSVHAALGIARFLTIGGARAEIVSSYAAGDNTAYLSHDYGEVVCHKLPRTFPQRLSAAGTLGPWLIEHLLRYDVVSIHGIFNLFSLRVAQVCRARGMPYFVHPHGSLDPFDLRKHFHAKQLVGPLAIRPMLAGSRGVICTSEVEAEKLELYGATTARYVAPLPVRLQQHSGDGVAFRAKYEIPGSAKVILFLSRIDYKKGLDALVPALGRLKEMGSDIYLVLAGSGEPGYVALVRGWIAESRLEDRVRWTGFLEGAAKADALAAANLFALPSQNENFGIVLVEAMHAGVPVLITRDVYIHPEIIAAGAGALCERSADSIAAVVGRLLSDETQLKRLGNAGRKLVGERYSAQAATDQLRAIYQGKNLGSQSQII